MVESAAAAPSHRLRLTQDTLRVGSAGAWSSTIRS
ncbi:hypothetical protein RKD33_007794 [Streptomyces sp. SAI-129]